MIRGLLLAAGAGTRMGKPKALVYDDRGSWLLRSVQVLIDGGCDGVTVVLGARADEAERILADGLPGGPSEIAQVDWVVAPDWQLGISLSLHAGLTALGETRATAAMLHLVDLPDVTAEVVGRLVAIEGDHPGGLARATYDGKPGHPVLIGRDHWAGVFADAIGDQGARGYLRTHRVIDVECGDLATGADVDSLH
ncbi:CTP:molybdopterin cytidylyltransferase MocA [Nocardioides thalensis]|uniref:CTP:molybdopterin cytidylyltransferase MocA n=1 Tax=Nocardioides thalensis TaxID=1914755 RepID=A0A853C047_9ACTN|nr:CTP:molybdopterin cytidylyltransferase MocA [Nocardioides thalensis]